MNGKYIGDNKFVQPLDITSYDVDSQFRLKPSAFMDMAQEIAYLAATEMGFGYDDLQKSGVVWVLSRMNLKFLKMPLWRDRITLQTWHKGARGPFFVRDFKLLSEDGEPLVLGTSSWVIMDVAARKLCRSEELVPDSTSCSDNAIEQPAGKVIMPKGVAAELAGERIVRYSDVDIVGHTNNAKYIVWSMDCIDYEELVENPVRELTVNFNHETRPGEKVRMEIAKVVSPEGRTSYYVDGRTDTAQAFCARIDL